ncbi:carbonyl reductase [Diplodia corticola]|uniref:Carbonyl reductase n=1 Tax=Diplodia corticola TaxID=236234 RepID=A0A1J9QQC5_9PEZI|nr:carbonyl reductase [Diplodia corticola]OJD30226.1 carbonyl reductase [Diplodia corticola]
MSNRPPSSTSDVLLYFLAIFVPPVPVFIKRGCGADFLINICLSILGWIPGVLHACWVISRTEGPDSTNSQKQLRAPRLHHYHYRRRPSPTMTTYARVAAVTGANKGIGLAIVRNLALQYPASALNTGPLLIYLTARDASRGQAALKTLESDDQLLNAKVLKAQDGPVSLAFKELDISKKESIDAFAAYLQKEHGSIDIVINNAGIAMDGFDSHVATTTIATNYHGTLHATLALLPLLKPASTSRLINVASTAGALSKYPPPLRARFLSAAASPSPTADAATALMHSFTDAVASDSHEALGFPSAAYAVSKAGVIAASMAIARWEVQRAKEEEGEGGGGARGVQVCCPGWVVTDMTKGKGVKGVDEGARTPVWLALGREGGERVGRGEFWRDERVVEW